MNSSKNEIDVSSFFTKHEYDFIGVDFQFEKLAEMTSENFVEKLKDKLNVSHYIKRMHVNKIDDCTYFINFFAEGFEEEDFQILKTYFSTTHGEYFSFNSISNYDLGNLGLNLVKKEDLVWLL